MDWRRFVAQPDSDTANSRFTSQHAGHCVLITGAGGSIGSALAKAIAGAGVERLLLLDSSEISLFDLQEQIHGEEGVASKIEEIAVGQDRRDLEHALPYSQKP